MKIAFPLLHFLMNNYLLALRSYLLKLSSLQNSLLITSDFKAIKYICPERYESNTPLCSNKSCILFCDTAHPGNICVEWVQVFPRGYLGLCTLPPVGHCRVLALMPALEPSLTAGAEAHVHQKA